MVEIKILKVSHEGTHEAKKLLPYIQECDVFSPERGLSTGQEAESFEMWWRKILNENRSRSKFQAELERLTAGFSPAQREYSAVQMDYLLRNRKPIYICERFSHVDSAKLKHDKMVEARMQIVALEDLLDGDLGRFFDSSERTIRASDEWNKKRDRHIADNLNYARERMVSIYPSLAQKGDLKVTICLGGLHQPEKYLEGPTTQVVDLTGQPKYYDFTHKMSHILCDTMMRGGSFEDMKPYLLAAALYKLHESGIVDLPSGKIERMGFEELCETAKTVPANLKIDRKLIRFI